jgi:predicted PurR-regulated permease PerM
MHFLLADAVDGKAAPGHSGGNPDQALQHRAAGQQARATKAVGLGQNTLGFVVGFGVMLYLIFFLLRDGKELVARIWAATPLAPEHKRELAIKFITVIRATVKGNLAVAAAQGALGG